MPRTIYKIMGTYQGETEELDETSDLRDAEYLLGEYRMAYGREWRIFIQGN